MPSNYSSISQILKSPEPNSPFSWTHLDNQKASCRDISTSGPKATDCWDFLQNATNTSTHGFKQTFTKPSTFLLSRRGLEMCTEILGSESGSCIDPCVDITTQDSPYSTKIKPGKTREILKKTKHVSSFPPPLTSITSGYGVKVEAHRGCGRLLITVVASSAAACRIYLKSERENGRLRVFLHKDYYRQSEQQLAEKIKQNGRKIRRNFKCGDASANKNLTSLPLCVAFT